MINRKELNDEELNKVTGGAKSVKEAKKEYRNKINDNVSIYIGEVTGKSMYATGIVKKRAIYYLDTAGYKYSPCYYVECENHPDLNGWYAYFLVYTYMLKVPDRTLASIQEIEC